jgi:hypothetical protein
VGAAVEAQVVSTYLTVDAEIRAEADRLLSRGLGDLLAAYGEVHVTGSYMLGLMTWRDLDIHLVREPLECNSFFALGGRLAALLEPHRMHYRDETVRHTPGLPRGLYWGIYLGDEREGAWKIDIWASSRGDYEPVRRFVERVHARLTPDTRDTILEIKTACWRHPEYRREFSSADVYEAVLTQGVKGAESFWSHLAAKRAPPA